MLQSGDECGARVQLKSDAWMKSSKVEVGLDYAKPVPVARLTA
jgi:hypothetical protein